MNKCSHRLLTCKQEYVRAKRRRDFPGTSRTRRRRCPATDAKPNLVTAALRHFAEERGWRSAYIIDRGMKNFSFKRGDGVKCTVSLERVIFRHQGGVDQLELVFCPLSFHESGKFSALTAHRLGHFSFSLHGLLGRVSRGVRKLEGHLEGVGVASAATAAVVE